MRLYAFFYDRPKAHPKLNKENCGEGIALLIMMEQLSQDMESLLKPLRQSAGPNVREEREEKGRRERGREEEEEVLESSIFIII